MPLIPLPLGDILPLSSFTALFPAFLCVLVGVCCLFVPYDVFTEDERVMFFYIASRMMGIILVIFGAFALWQAAT